MSNSRPRQLRFAFAESPQGNDDGRKADGSAGTPKSVHTAKRSQRSGSSPSAAGGRCSLLALVADQGNLKTALAKVVRNKGAPGVDKQTVDEVSRNAERLLPKLRDALLGETYVPGDIRRVWIPKPSGGRRGLGIPTVMDRWVQQAALQILGPIYEPSFHPSSHGFRPGRGAHTAIAESAGYVTQGLRYVVDIDLESFFDRVSHQRLLDRLAQKIEDRKLLRIIRLMLKANVVLPDGTKLSPEEGTPQGGPLSPLLSNIVLDELDQELERRGLHFVRYADDCNIYVRSERAGQRVMASTRRFIEGRLRLKVNEAKSAVDVSHRRHFLGFRVSASRNGWLTVMLSQRTFQRLDARLRAMTRRNWGSSLKACMQQLSIFMRGWMNYFRLCTKAVLRTLRYFDGHVRRRLRAIIVKQKKRPRHLFRELRRRHVSPASAAKTAYSSRGLWWMSRSTGMNRGYSNAWFSQRLTSLVTLWEDTHYDWRAHHGMAS